MIVSIFLKDYGDGHTPLQIVASSPAEDWHQIEFGYTKMIMSAKNRFTYRRLILYRIMLILMH